MEQVRKSVWKNERTEKGAGEGGERENGARGRARDGEGGRGREEDVVFISVRKYDTEQTHFTSFVQILLARRCYSCFFFSPSLFPLYISLIS